MDTKNPHVESVKRYQSKYQRIVLLVTHELDANIDSYLLDHGIKSRSEWIRQAIIDKMERDS